jgi:putative nucleotidyltransferase with HDIG domain
MGMGRVHDRPWLLRWVATWIGLVSVQLAAAVLPGTTPLWTSPVAMFWIVVIAASMCAIAAAVVIVVATKQDLAELGLVGAFGWAVSVLPLVHGITAPGVLYGDNAATMSSVMLALPVASVAVLPLAAPTARWSLAVVRNWHVLAAGHVGFATVLAAFLLLFPNAIPAPRMGAMSSVAISIASLSVCFVISLRHLRLSWVGRSRKSVAVSMGFALLGVSNLVWVGQVPFTAGFWLAHALDIMGVLFLTVGAVVAYGRRQPLNTVIRPLLANEPLRAFELGLEPVVHHFVAALEHKDPVTRDHVVRSAAMAMRVGETLHVPASELHVLGLGALLHDVGKLTVDDAILNKPGRLDDDERLAMQAHPVTGAQMVARSSVLEGVAPIVRSHHERIDGRGYPDGLTGESISLAARIVSVCDAYDAMANTRQYRVGMGHDKAVAILQEHAGSQWDATVVTALIATLGKAPIDDRILADVGRSMTSHHMDGPTASCGCEDALPTEALVMLSTG